jgi:hypothetical protein
MFTNSLVAHSNTSRDTGREKPERRKSHGVTGQREGDMLSTGRKNVSLLRKEKGE